MPRNSSSPLLLPRPGTADLGLGTCSQEVAESLSSICFLLCGTSECENPQIRLPACQPPLRDKSFRDPPCLPCPPCLLPLRQLAKPLLFTKATVGLIRSTMPVHLILDESSAATVAQNGSPHTPTRTLPRDDTLLHRSSGTLALQIRSVNH